VFLCEIFFIGIAWNQGFIIYQSRMNQKLLAVSFELSMSVGTGTVMILPILTKQPEPMPTMLLVLFCCFTIFLICSIGGQKVSKQGTLLDKIEHSIIDPVMSMSHQKSSVILDT